MTLVTEDGSGPSIDIPEADFKKLEKEGLVSMCDQCEPRQAHTNEYEYFRVLNVLYSITKPRVPQVT